MTIQTQPNNLGIDFSHRFENKVCTKNEIDQLFHTLGFMVERAEGVLELLFGSTDDDAPVHRAVDAALCEVKDMSSLIGVLHQKVNLVVKDSNNPPAHVALCSSQEKVEDPI